MSPARRKRRFQEQPEITDLSMHHFHLQPSWYATVPTKRKPEYLSQTVCQPVLDLDGLRSRSRNPLQRILLGNLSGPLGSLSPQNNLSVNTGVFPYQPSQTDSVSSSKPTSSPNTYLLRPESLNPLANGFLSIFRRVICEDDLKNDYLQIQLSTAQNYYPDRIKLTVDSKHLHICMV